MNRWFSLNVVLCILFQVAATSTYKSKPCLVQYEENCKKPCDCAGKTSESSFYSIYLTIVKGIKKRCECDGLCTRTIKTECGHGVCDERARSCKCSPCWKGKTCQTYENPNAPFFQQDKYSHFIPTSARIGTVLTKVKADDKDAEYCESKQKCPCGEIKYHLNEKKSNYAPFYINLTTGEIIVDGHLLQPRYILHIEATNANNQIMGRREMAQISSAIITVTVTGMNKPAINQASDKHRRQRRAATDDHSLIFFLIPNITTTFYFERGETIFFDGSLYHNTTFKAVGEINFGCTSDNLAISSAAFSFSSSTDANSISNPPHFKLDKLLFDITGLAQDETITIGIRTIVRSDIPALAPLDIKCTLSSSLSGNPESVLYNITSTPVVYGAYPTIILTRSHQDNIGTYDPPTVFSAKICFPNINMFAIFEVTANIEEYQFMTVDNGIIVDKQKLSFNGTATPEYFVSQPFYGNSRIAFDFGYVKVEDPNRNCMTVNFSLTVKDHHLLENGSTHWIGMGLKSDKRVLWVEQTSVKVNKVEPALNLTVSSSSVSSSSTVYIDDVVVIEYEIGHASTSQQQAESLSLIMSLTYFEPTSGMIASEVTSLNETHYTITNVQNKQLQQGDVLRGSLNMTIGQEVAPLATAEVKFTLTYKNGGGQEKLPLDACITAFIGTPLFLLTMDGSNDMMPGEQRNLTLEILITKISTPCKIELISQSENKRPLFSIHDVSIVSIGSNLQKIKQDAKPFYNSTDPNPSIKDIVTIDFGNVLNIDDDTSDRTENKIIITFMITMNCHANLTINSTRYWIGAGMYGGDELLWVGQISIFGFIPFSHRPWMNLEWLTFPSVLPLSPGKILGMTFGIHHSPLSSCFAYNITLNVMLPHFVTHNTSMNEHTRGNYTYKEHRVVFEYMQEFSFLDKTIGGKNSMFAMISNDKITRTGEFNLTIAAILTYYDGHGKDYNILKVYNAPASIPVTTTPTPTTTTGAKPTVTIDQKPEFYHQGIAWDHETDPTVIYVCVGKNATHNANHLPSCYSTANNGDYFDRENHMLGSVVGIDAANKDIYGVSYDRKAYMKLRQKRKRWTSMSGKDYQAKKATLGTNYLIRDPATPSGSPINGANQIKAFASGVWAMTGSGVYFASGALDADIESMPWELKVTWECSRPECS